MGRKGSGVEAREKSIRIQFVFNGPQRETLRGSGGQPLPPTPANIKLAHRLADDIRRAVDLGTFSWEKYFPHSVKAAAITPQSLGYFGKLWLESKGQLTDATLYQYEGALELWYEILGKETPMDRLTYQLIAAKVGSYEWSSSKRMNNALIPLRGVFDFYYVGPASANNPLQFIKNSKPLKKLPDPLTAHERDRILADLRKHYDPRVYAYFLFAFYTGMRPEEIIAIRWSDIDFNAETVRLQRVRTFKGSEREGSKTHTERDVDLVPEAMAALQIMKPYTFLKRHEDGTDMDVFENPVTKRPWHDERSQRDHYWKPSLKRLGIRYRRAYCTRHTLATIALMGGVNPLYLALQLGHSVRVLSEVYARWVPKADGGAEKLRLAKAVSFQDSSPIHPQDQTTSSKSLIQQEGIGRRDWIRNNPKR